MLINYSLVISCYNESGNIKDLYSRVKIFNNLREFELILVDNGSTDDTLKKIESLKPKTNFFIKIVKIKKNIGFGNGLIQGFKKCSGKFIIYTHADKEIEILDVKKAIDIQKKIKIKNNLFIKGLRINRKKNHWSFLDNFFSIGCDLFVSFFFMRYLNDVHAQPVMFDRTFLKNINFFPKDFLIDVYLLLSAKKQKKKNYKISCKFQ